MFRWLVSAVIMYILIKKVCGLDNNAVEDVPNDVVAESVSSATDPVRKVHDDPEYYEREHDESLDEFSQLNSL